MSHVNIPTHDIQEGTPAVIVFMAHMTQSFGNIVDLQPAAIPSVGGGEPAMMIRRLDEEIS